MGKITLRTNGARFKCMLAMGVWVVGYGCGPKKASDAEPDTFVEASQLSKTDIAKLTAEHIPAPNIRIKTENGEFDLHSQRGKVVLIDFWGTWCGPCRQSIPGLIRLYNSKKDTGFVVMGVAMEQDDGSQVEPYAKEIGMTYPHGLPVANKDLEPYAPASLPYMVLVDKKGDMRWAQGGYNDEVESRVRQLVTALLEEPN